MKPPIVKAMQAGNCYVCGGRFYYGDRIRVITDNTYTPPITKACHSGCK